MIFLEKLTKNAKKYAKTLLKECFFREKPREAEQHKNEMKEIEVLYEEKEHERAG